MKKIENKGNLPALISVFAKQLGGVFSGVKQTEFYEAESITELELSVRDIGLEIVPSLDSVTNRGYLVAFDATDSVIVSPTGGEYSQLKMYFVEITEEQLKAWDKKIKEHRDLQLEDMDNRRKINEKSRQKLDVKYD
jgi:hypothetical protein